MQTKIHGFESVERSCVGRQSSTVVRLMRKGKLLAIKAAIECRNWSRTSWTVHDPEDFGKDKEVAMIPDEFRPDSCKGKAYTLIHLIADMKARFCPMLL